MKSKIKLALAVALIALCVAAFSAEEKFGVKVYEGAKLDKDISEWVSEMMSLEAFSYSTSDSLDKVVAFYKKEPGLEFIGVNKEGVPEDAKEGAMFKKGDVEIIIQNPWQDIKTGQLIKGTLITIAKSKPTRQDQR